MMLRTQTRQQSLFYGCSRFPECWYTFDADQITGAPIPHLRHGTPFRAPIGVRKKDSTFWDALRTPEFELCAGKSLEQKKKQTAKRRRQALKDMDREAVQARLKAAAPKSKKDWLEQVLVERQLAIDEYVLNEFFRRAQEEKFAKDRRQQSRKRLNERPVDQLENALPSLDDLLDELV